MCRRLPERQDPPRKHAGIFVRSPRLAATSSCLRRLQPRLRELTCDIIRPFSASGRIRGRYVPVTEQLGSSASSAPGPRAVKQASAFPSNSGGKEGWTSRRRRREQEDLPRQAAASGLTRTKSSMSMTQGETTTAFRRYYLPPGQTTTTRPPSLPPLHADLLPVL
ncbi:hypothetical protein CSOJ01_13561 [Colletotrichum sojae]|uniref:Uncharacterized protein n=1 Tax=Colletotrichum sojae TaxID=2175907 RepID=A0A8H6ISU0_9PEZI|nr:hypothetical protein CSOJ01_13561 [Colletotrichum sojae]